MGNYADGTFLVVKEPLIQLFCCKPAAFAYEPWRGKVGKAESADEEWTGGMWRDSTTTARLGRLRKFLCRCRTFRTVTLWDWEQANLSKRLSLSFFGGIVLKQTSSKNATPVQCMCFVYFTINVREIYLLGPAILLAYFPNHTYIICGAI